MKAAVVLAATAATLLINEGDFLILDGKYGENIQLFLSFR